MAWLSDASVNEFLGAKWNQHTHQNVTQLEAYFRVKQLHADKLKQSSGSRGLFISAVESGPRTRKPPSGYHAMLMSIRMPISRGLCL